MLMKAEDFDASFFTMSAAAPSPEAVRAASEILLKSIESQSRQQSSQDGAITEKALDHRMQALGLAEDTLRRILAEERSTAQRDRNTLQPLHSLPLELFIDILALTLEDEHPATHYARLGVLRTVCSHWHDVIQGTPGRFYTVVSTTAWEEVQEKALVSSNAAGLSVYRPIRHRTDAEFLERVFPHVHRWRRVFLHCNSPRSILKLLETPAPMLEHLQLAMGNPWGGLYDKPASELPCLFKGVTPRLRSLSLTHMPLSINWSSLTNLVSLELDRCRGLNISAVGMVDLLSHNLRLESLKLQMMLLDDSLLSDPPNPVVLPLLKNLTLSFNESVATSLCILRNVKAPKCSNITVQCRWGIYDIETAPSTFIEGLTQFLRTAAPLAYPTLAEPVHIQISAFKTVLSNFPGLKFETDAHIYRYVTNMCVEWLADTLRHVDPLRVNLVLDEQFDVDAVVTLTGLPSVHVTALEFTPERASGRKLLEYLASRVDAEGFRFLPELKRLRLKGREMPWREVQTMVRQRYVQAWPEDAPLPERLERLQLCISRDFTLQALEEIELVVGREFVELERDSGWDVPWDQDPLVPVVEGLGNLEL